MWKRGVSRRGIPFLFSFFALTAPHGAVNPLFYLPLRREWGFTCVFGRQQYEITGESEKYRSGV